MLNRLLLVLILIVVIGIGAYLVHEENESPAEKVGEAAEEVADEVKNIFDGATQ